MSRRHLTATVLFVDDEPRVTEALVRGLRNEPYEFLTADSAAEALAVLESVPVDVIVADERMPGMTGSELFATVRRRYPNAMRIILSGQASLESAVRAINEGEVFRFLLKPCQPAEVRATVRQALQQKRLYDVCRLLLHRHDQQAKLMEELEAAHPGITSVHYDAEGAMIAGPPGDETSMDELLRQMESAVAEWDARTIRGRRHAHLG